MNSREWSELCMRHGAAQKPEELELLHAFLQGKCCKTVLEIGTYHGGTLWGWHHLDGNGTVISVDLPGGGFGNGLTDSDKAEIQSWLAPQQDTCFFALDSHKPETLRGVRDYLGSERLDILFIDGDHTYEGVKADFDMYSPLVRKGGLIILHDICDHSTTSPTCTVDRFWNEVKHGSGFYEFVAQPRTWGGIGVIQW